MNRREFIEAAGMSLTAGLTTPSFADLLSGAPSGQSRRAFGSGYFGEWIVDEHGLPAYRYTCDQRTDPHATTPVHKDLLGPTDHLHAVGNDRLVAVASNYGYVQVRQDEGAPKYLNDYAPEQNRFGGGIGYLTDGQTVLSTYYPGKAESFDRIFGEGYARKLVKGGQYTVDQTIFAPYGDDPVVISLVKITNRGGERADLRWVEYWGASNYQFSYRSRVEGRFLKDKTGVAGRRRLFADRFEHSFEITGRRRGLMERQRFLGRTAEDEDAWTKFKAATGAAEPQASTSFDDLIPPPTFLISLDAPMDAYATNGAAFFGSGGVLDPEGLKTRLDNELTTKDGFSAHLVERIIALEPNQTRSMAFLYGYLPEGFELDALLARYSADPIQVFAHSCAQWKTGGVRVSTPDEPWVEREISWHNYYLRSALTYDSFFREHILSQGCVYQYIIGFQGAARDPLQHALPFIFSDPGIVKQVIRYTMKEIQSDGSIPFYVVGAGITTPSQSLPPRDHWPQPSDQEMWLLWVLSEYVLATRDKAFLEEKIPLYPRREVQLGDPTVKEVAMRCFQHLVNVIGVGEHDLIRVLAGDWNDDIVRSYVPDDLKVEVHDKGESTLNSAMACYVLDHYARMLNYLGDGKAAENAHIKAVAQRAALSVQWAGRWFRRGWLGPHLGWLGNDHLWLEPQPWAIIGSAATAEQSITLIKAIDELVRKPSPIGALVQSQATPSTTEPPGIMVNGGVWASINGTLIWALAMKDGSMAWDEWKKNTLAAHAEAYPNVWYGIWSGPDYYNSVLSDHPGETRYSDPTSANASEHADTGTFWTDFPVMCQHQHAWPLYTLAKLLGLEFEKGGIRVKPNLPMQEFAFKSALVGLSRSKTGYSGWYDPSVAGSWEVAVLLSEAERSRLRSTKVNGATQPLQARTDPIQLKGESRPGKPLHWELILA
jgi:hypothetical protein